MSNPITNNYTMYTNTSKAANAKNGEFWYEDGSNDQVSMQSFLQLMIAQLKNQDFNNTMDDTQFVTQMAQFSTLQAMTELASYSKLNYASSILGKEVAYKTTVGSETRYEYGKVDAISSKANGEPILYINNAEYSLADIAQVYPDASLKETMGEFAEKITTGIDELVAEVEANTTNAILSIVSASTDESEEESEESEEETSLADTLTLE